MGILLDNSTIINQPENVMTTDTDQEISCIKTYMNPQTAYRNGWRVISTDNQHSAFLRYDNDAFYILFSDTPYGDYNDARPFCIPTNASYILSNGSDKPNTAVVTQGIQKSNIGYMKLGNGIIIQWGAQNTLNKTIIFPVPFSNTDYATNLGFVIANRGRQRVTKYTTHMVTSSEVQNSDTDGWIAIGY